MPTHAEAPPSGEGSVEVGPPPYYHRSDCHICRKQDGLKTGSELLDAPIPGGYVVEGQNFLALHAPIQESSAGTVIVEARRHLLDFGEMTTTESAELGSILDRLVPAIKAATSVERVYYPAVMEHSPHFTSGSYRGRAKNFEESTTWHSDHPSRAPSATQRRCRRRSERRAAVR
jgi:hypothetical protein